MLNMSTWWNTTYLILDVACKYERTFEIHEDANFKFDLLLGEGKGVPERKDCDSIKMLCIFLKKFYDITQSFWL